MTGGTRLEKRRLVLSAAVAGVVGLSAAAPSRPARAADLTVNGNTFSVLNSPDVGPPGEGVTLNGGGTLQLVNQTNNAAGAGFLQFDRTINVDTGGGFINVPGPGSNNAATVNGGAALMLTNALSGNSTTLTKNGLGFFFFLNSNATYGGDLVIGPSGGLIDVRGNGSLSSLNRITVNQSSFLNLDNNNGLGFVASVANADRLADAIPVDLAGGRLQYLGRNVALSGTSSREIVGTVSLLAGQSEIRAERSGGGGSDLIISNLARTFGGGTVRFTGGNTIGNAGDNGRITLNSVNGVAMTATPLIGGWALLNSTDFAGYTVPASPGAAGGVVTSTYTAATTAASFLAANVVNQTGDVTLNAGDSTVRALRMSGGADRNLTFTNPGDTLFVTSGGVLADGSLFARNIGTVGVRGQLTAGAGGATAPQELFLHNNVANVMTVNSVIIDNNGQPVRVVKDLDGQVNLTATNTFSGGVLVERGTLEAQAVGALGTGAVTVKNSRLNVNVAGAIGGATGAYTAVDNGEIYLNSGTEVFNTATDRFTIPAGGVIMGQSPNAGQGLNSLQRVTTLSGGGQVVLAPGAIVGHATFVNSADNGTGANTIQGLPTDASLFYGLGNGNANAGPLQSVALGAGTPWAGMSTDRGSRAFQQGTIVLNSNNVIFQGLLRDGSNATLTLGDGGNGTFGITNSSGGAAQANLVGNVTLAEPAPLFPSDLTFVATPGAGVLLSINNALGADTSSPANNARLIVQRGASLNLGGGQVLPINGHVTMEAGSRFLADDNTAGGALLGIGTMTFKTGAIADVTQGLGMAGTQPLVWEPGAIVRLQTTPVGMNRFGPDVTYEVFNGNRNVTGQAIPENVTANGATFTNDSASRNLDSANGRVLIGAAGATFAGTTGTTFGFNEDFDLAGNTVTVGSTGWIAGNPKMGIVGLGGQGSRSLAAGRVEVLDGVQLRFTTQNAFPDLATLQLNGASSLFTNQNDFIETIGGLSGSGNILTDQSGGVPAPTIRVGLNNLDTTYSGALSNAGGQNPGLTKIGTGTLTMTGVSNSVRPVSVDQGTLRYAGAGSSQAAQHSVNPGGVLTLDNSGTNTSNRLGGSAKNLVIAGGTFNLIGGAGGANESLNVLNMSGGGQGAINIAPGANSAILSFLTLNGRDRSTLVVSAPNLGGTAGSGVGNFIVSGATNLLGASAGNVATTPGTTTVAIRPDILSDTPSTGGTAPLGFTTIDNTGNGLRRLNDATEYSTTINGFTTTTNNVSLAAPAVFPAATSVIAPAANTQVQSLTLRAGATAVTNGGGVTLTGGTPQFQVSSGGYLVQPGVNATISSPFIGGTFPQIFHTYGNLAVDGQFTTGGLIKSGPGTLTLSAGAVRNTNGNISINGGSVTLGANNSFLLTTGGAVNAPNLLLAAGTLDLNGNSQTFNQFASVNTQNSPGLPGQGGNIVNSGARATITAFSVNNNGATVATNGNTFAGTISGPLDFVKAGGSALGFLNPVSFETVTLRGGPLQLREAATMSNATSLTMNFATILLDNQQGVQNVNNRLAPGVAVTMRGATFEHRGSPGNASSQTIASVELDAGANFLNNFSGGNGSAELIINGFSRNAATGATVDFRGNNLGRQAPTGTGGVTPMNNDSRTIITAGLPPTATYNNATAASTTNGFFGGWAVVFESDFVSYLNPAAPLPGAATAAGVSNWGNTGLGYPAYTAATTAATPGVNGFVSGAVSNFAADGTIGTAGSPTTFFVGALRMATNTTRTLNFANATDTLNIESGGLLRSNDNNATVFGSAATRGQITAGGAGATGTQDLYLHFNQNTATFNSLIVNNNAAAPVRVVKDLGGTVEFTGVNTYTGGTLVNAGTLRLNATGGQAIQGDLALNNATVNLVTPGQLAGTNNVSINNGGTLLLPLTTGNTTTTIGNVSFTNLGGGGNPNTNNGGAPVAVSTTLTNTLVVAGNITSLNDSPATTPTFNGVSTTGTGAASSASVTIVDFGAGGGPNGERPVTINTSGTSLNGLNFNAGIQRGAITKTGPTMLVLAPPLTNTQSGVALPTSTFGGGLNINEGQVRADNINALSTVANTVTVGTGSPSAAALVVNTGTIPANVTLALNGGLLAGYNNSPTINGTVNVAAASTIAVNDFYQTTTARSVTIAGQLTGSAPLTIRASPVLGNNGTLTLTNAANNYTGPVTIQPNAFVTANSAATVGNVFTTGAITMQGGTLNIRDNGTGSDVPLVGYGNNLNVTGNAVLSADRSSANTGNTLPFNNVAISNAVLTVTTGNAYQVSFNGTATLTGEAGVNASAGGPVNVGPITGAGNLTKYGGSQVNVTAPSTGFTGGTTVAQGTLRVAPTPAGGAALGTGPLVVRPTAVLQTDVGNANTATYAASSVLNDGLIYARTGVTDLSGRQITTTPSLGLQPLSALAERFTKPLDVGEADNSFSEAASSGDPYLLLENANNFLTPAPGPGVAGTLAADGLTPLRFDGPAINARSGNYTTADQFGAAWRGTFTVGGTVPAGPISFGTSSDDGSVLYVDVNGDHAFTANERVVDNRGLHGVVNAVGTATLAAGTYDVAVGFYEAGGGEFIEARFAAGANVSYANQFVFNPGGSINPAGSLQADSGATLLAGGFTANNVTINGGTVTTTTAGGASTANQLINTAAGTVDVGGTLANPHRLTVGVTNLTAGQTLTKLGSGTLLVNGTGVGGGTLAVLAGTLGGSGSVAGPVSVASGAFISPGNSPGILGTGDLALAGGSTYVLEVDGTTAGTGYDRISVTGTADVTGSLLLVDVTFPSTAATPYYILTNDAADPIVGTFASVNGAPFTDNGNGTFSATDGLGNQFTVTYTAEFDTLTPAPGAGNDVLLNITAVPEPGSLALLGLGGLALAGGRRRRREVR